MSDETVEKGPGGRPTKYLPEYCEKVIEYGAIGMSRAEIAANLGVAKRTLVVWEAAHPQFLSAMEHAKTLEQCWWERKGRENLEAQHFQSSMWSRSMSARFPDDWREVSRQERTGPNGGPQEVTHSGSIGEVLSRISRLAARSTEGGDSGASE